MNRHKIICGVVLFMLALGSTVGVLAQALEQTGRGDFRIVNIQQRQINAPSFGTTGDIGGRSPALAQNWLRVETQFQSQPDWADDVTLKYYVLVGKGRDAKLLIGEVTHINVARGSHYSAMFIHPNTLERYGRGQVEAVAVQLRHQGRLIDQKSKPDVADRWWERYTPVTGYVLSPKETPWSVLSSERYEALKSTP